MECLRYEQKPVFSETSRDEEAGPHALKDVPGIGINAGGRRYRQIDASELLSRLDKNE